nr:hypothetical protein [Tanacetum cinerariifolium]
MPRGSLPHQPPPPPPPAGSSGTSGSPRASGPSQVPPLPPPPPSANQEDLHMDNDLAPGAQVHSFDDEDIGNAHIPKLNLASTLASTYSPPLKDSLLAQTGDMAMCMDWFCKRQRITKLKSQDLEGPAFELVKVFHPNMLIEEECKYDIAAMYSISHWWFQRQRFYINRHTYKGDCRAARTHIRILSVIRIEVFSMYVYDYMKKIVLHRADLNEHIITERDFKYLYPSNFEYLYLLNVQGHLNHLPPKYKKILTIAVNLWTRHLVIKQRVKDFQLGIKSYQTQLNLAKPRWDVMSFEYKHDFTVIDSPRAITF